MATHTSSYRLAQKEYSRFYIVNALVGGYSTKEVRANGTVITGMVDFVPVKVVLVLAMKSGRSKISLAGSLWEKVGLKGWGQKVTIRTARNAIKKLGDKV